MHIFFKCFIFRLCFFLLAHVDVYKSYKIHNVGKNILHNVKKSEKLSTFRTYGKLEKVKKNTQNKFKLHGSLNDYIYKLLIKKFKKQKEKKNVNIYKTLQSAKASYNIDFLFSCNYLITEIKQKLIEYSYELKLIEAENIKVSYLGKKKLSKPINKQLEAYYILFTFEIYPSMIKEISIKLKLQPHVLRFIIIKNEKESRNLEFKENEITRDSILKAEQNFFNKI